MIFQSAKLKQNERLNTKKMVEWESPKWIDVKSGDTIGERRL